MFENISEETVEDVILAALAEKAVALKEEIARIPDEHLRKPCPDGNFRRGTEKWVPGQGWVTDEEV